MDRGVLGSAKAVLEVADDAVVMLGEALHSRSDPTDASLVLV